MVGFFQVILFLFIFTIYINYNYVLYKLVQIVIISFFSHKKTSYNDFLLKKCTTYFSFYLFSELNNDWFGKQTLYAFKVRVMAQITYHEKWQVSFCYSFYKFETLVASCFKI